MSLGTSNRDGGKTSESGHLRALAKIVTGDIITGLNAVQRAAGVNMSVDVQVGDAFVRRSDGTYAHPVFNDAVYNQVISAADGSNPRRDIVVIYVDYGQTPSTAVSNNTNGVVKIKVVNGTPAGSPVDPSAPTIQASVGAGNPYSILARVRVPAGQTSISNSLIDDLRSMTTANITNATITNAKLSTAAGELGGEWAAYSPITSGFSSIAENVGRYIKIGSTVTIYLSASGTSNTAYIGLNLPFSARNSMYIPVRVLNNSTNQDNPGMIEINASSSAAVVYRSFTGGGFVASGTKALHPINFTYEIDE